MPNTIFIIVEDGRVSSVYGTTRLNVEVVDLDSNDEDDSSESRARAVELEKLAQENKLIELVS